MGLLKLINNGFLYKESTTITVFHSCNQIGHGVGDGGFINPPHFNIITGVKEPAPMLGGHGGTFLDQVDALARQDRIQREQIQQDISNFNAQTTQKINVWDDLSGELPDNAEYLHYQNQVVIPNYKPAVETAYGTQPDGTLHRMDNFVPDQWFEPTVYATIDGITQELKFK